MPFEQSDEGARRRDVSPYLVASILVAVIGAVTLNVMPSAGIWPYLPSIAWFLLFVVALIRVGRRALWLAVTVPFLPAFWYVVINVLCAPTYCDL